MLSSSLYKQIDEINNNQQPLGSLLSRGLSRSDLGKEIGSVNYVNNSDFFFVKTKALQPHSFLPIFNSESTESIMPQSFIKYDLKAGDIIISKDSNIGEIIVLDKDYPNYMLSGALYKLPIDETLKYYILSFVKHRFFRDQLDSLVPKGATIRHAGTKFLDCNIPFPVDNKKSVIEYVSDITQRIVRIEAEIIKRYDQLNAVIEDELSKNVKTDNTYKYTYPTYNQISENLRLDTGVYSDGFQKITHLITNYKFGTFYIEEKKIKSGNTPKIREIAKYEEGDIRWVTPTNCSDYGFIQLHEKISSLVKNNLNEDAVLLINRTSRGGKGEYVGIGTFYDYGYYGRGHHNQGMYRITGYDKEVLVFITAFMNMPMMRKYCSALCVGSKMKEIKSEQFLSIPFPKFPKDILEKIYELFYTENYDGSIRSMLSADFTKTGLFHLSVMNDRLKGYLDTLLDMIVENVDIKTLIE